MKDRCAGEGVCEVDCVDGPRAHTARAALPPEEQSRDVADALKVLAHPGRLRVLHALDGRELCVCDLAHVLGLSLSGMSHQLRELRRLGAVQFRAEGKLAYYRIGDPFWLQLAGSVTGKLHQQDAKAG
jgi:DNA-binding transcriptional ArsR family regulator